MMTGDDSFTPRIQNDRLRRVNNDRRATDFIPWVEILKFVNRSVDASVGLSKVHAVSRRVLR